MHTTKRQQQDVGVYLPSKRAIAAACLRMHGGWSEHLAIQRVVQKIRPVEIMVVPVTREIAEVLGEII